MPYSHIDTWIFDMDNTLYPSDDGFNKLYWDAFSKHVMELYNIPQEKIQEYFSELVEKYGDERTGLIIERNFDYDGWMVIANETVNCKVVGCPLTTKLVDQLYGKKVVCTNAGDISTVCLLDNLGMGATFHHINDFKTRGFISKPNPDVYTNLIKELNLNPKTCAFFEDSADNLKPAHELGMTTVLVHGEKEGRDYIHHAYPSLLDFLKEHSN